MPRKGPPSRRPVTPDVKYSDAIVSNVMNKVMWNGNKRVAEKIVYGAMDKAAERLGDSPLNVMHRAIEAVKPEVEVKSRRVGGATYQVPMEVSPKRRLSLAVRWLVEYSRKRSEHTMMERLGNEMVDAIQERGGAYKKRDETHRMAEANQAFAHYRW